MECESVLGSPEKSRRVALPKGCLLIFAVITAAVAAAILGPLSGSSTLPSEAIPRANASIQKVRDGGSAPSNASIEVRMPAFWAFDQQVQIDLACTVAIEASIHRQWPPVFPEGLDPTTCYSEIVQQYVSWIKQTSLGKPCVLHVHVPKAGGSTMHNVWHKADLKEATGNSVREIIDECKRIRCDVVAGHFGVHALGQIMSEMPFGENRRQCLVITEIRDPVENSFSAFHYWRDKPWRLAGAVDLRPYYTDNPLEWKRCLGQPAQSPICASMGNHLVRTFADAPGTANLGDLSFRSLDWVSRFENGRPNCEHLNSAMRNLARRPHLILVNEEIDDSLKTLSVLLGRNFTVQAEHMNPDRENNFSSYERSVSPDVWSIAQAATALDRTLYTHGRRVAHIQRSAILEAARQIHTGTLVRTAHEPTSVPPRADSQADISPGSVPSCEFPADNSLGRNVTGCGACADRRHPPVNSSHEHLLQWHSTRLGGDRYKELFKTDAFRACSWHACNGVLNSPWIARFDLSVGTPSNWQLTNKRFDFYLRHGFAHGMTGSLCPRTVHVKSDALPKFVDTVLPQIAQDCRFALYVGDGDITIMRAGVDVPKLARDERVRAILAENNDAPPELNVIAMPLGFHPKQLLLNWEALRQIRTKAKTGGVKAGVVGGWSPWGKTIFGTREDRSEGKQWMLRNPQFATFVEDLSQEDFWSMVASHRFFLSPLGLTYDGFKMFEALALGTIPIIQRVGTWADAYVDLPVVLIDSFDDITPAAMATWWTKLSPQLDQIHERLISDYWWAKVAAVANGVEVPFDRIMLEARLVRPPRERASADNIATKPTGVFGLITEPRCFASLPFVLENALRTLNVVVFFHSKYNRKCTELWLRRAVLESAHAEGRLNVFESSAMTLGKDIYKKENWNNRMYLNATFWGHLRQFGSSVLTIQTDTLICSSNWINWGVNYIGGVSAHPVSPSLEQNANHLNGGLSIRRLDWILACLATTDDGVEDSIFNTCGEGRSSVSVVHAMRFASDNGHTACFNWSGDRICPWGIHKPWRFTSVSDYKELTEYCPGILTLRELQHETSWDNILNSPVAVLSSPESFPGAVVAGPKRRQEGSKRRLEGGGAFYAWCARGLHVVRSWWRRGSAS